MTQLFKNNDDCEFFHGVIEESKKQVNGYELLKMVDEITSSEMLGELIFEHALDWGQFDIDRDFFIKNSKPILEAMQRAGCLPAYITLIKAMLGEKTEVKFYDINTRITDDTDPQFNKPDKNGWLIVDIKEEVVSEGQLGGEAMTTDGTLKGDLVSDAGVDKGLYFLKTKASHTVIEALKILNIIKPKGIFTEFRIVK